jgi:dienelactone hydrolase
VTNDKGKMFCVFLCLFVAIIFSSVANAEEIARGQVIPKVTGKIDAQFSYALYLPSYYTPEKKFPVIYAFEPAARGAYPVERFKEAAEKFGYVIIASNDSRNGLSSKQLLPIINDLFDDTLARFSLDQSRVYLTGFSGGARVALSYALGSKGWVAGVIACGAGFPPDAQITTDLPFVIFGTVGNEDFNYPEMRTLDETLSKLNITHRFVTFEGTHDWASSELCIKAVEWLELQAMKTNRRQKDEAFIENLWKKNFEEANNAETNGKIYEAFVSFNALAQDFKELKDVSEIEKRVVALRENKIVRQALKDEKDEIEKQNALVNQLISQGAKIVQADSSERPTMMQDLRSLAASVRKRAQAEENTSDRRVARRSIRSAFAFYYETATLNFLPNKKFDLAILYMEIATELTPKNVFMFVELARVYAVAKQKKKAFQALQKAVEKGFNDLKVLEENKDFDTLRGESDWQKLVESIKQKSSTKNT